MRPYPACSLWFSPVGEPSAGLVTTGKLTVAASEKSVAAAGLRWVGMGAAGAAGSTPAAASRPWVVPRCNALIRVRTCSGERSGSVSAAGFGSGAGLRNCGARLAWRTRRGSSSVAFSLAGASVPAVGPAGASVPAGGPAGASGAGGGAGRRRGGERRGRVQRNRPAPLDQALGAQAVGDRAGPGPGRRDRRDVDRLVARIAPGDGDRPQLCGALPLQRR